MECYKILPVAIFSFLLVLPNTQGWGRDGHFIVCEIAQSRLDKSAAEVVRKLLPKQAKNDLASLCSWPDDIRDDHRYNWASALHFVNTPDRCDYEYDRDCKDPKTKKKGRCVVGAITNYTKQLLNYDHDTYNPTEALLFLSHFMGDIHQPLHCGYGSDHGGNKIVVNWYGAERNLHYVWDASIIKKAEEKLYYSKRGYIKAIQKNITKVWKDQVKGWESCSPNEIPCPDIYASESSKAARQWAYEGAPNNAVLKDDYFLSRLPVVNLGLARAGVRLAAYLNHIFGRQCAS